MGKSKKYRTEEGDTLIIKEGNHRKYRIWWHIFEWGEDGSCLGEQSWPRNKPVDRDDWESWQADQCVSQLTTGRDSTGFYFDTKKAANIALKAANEGLFTGEPPLPAWAIQAKASGWTPPLNWKP